MIFLILGWVGTAAYLINHIYLSTNRDYNERLYFSVNFPAASALVASSFVIESWQAVATNLFWAIVSLAALCKMRFDFVKVVSERWVLLLIFLLAGVGVLWAIFDFHRGMSILGWAATLLFSAAYLFLATHSIRRRRFLGFNVFAAFSLVPILYLQSNWPVMVLECAWGCISLLGWRNAHRDHPDR